jgi:8-oxo-dGTP pyrophosphatase MutT (NUDIX family)
MVRHTMVGGLLVKGHTVLLGKRTSTRELAPDTWDVFGGHVEPDESDAAALVRELREELGILVKRVTSLGPLGDRRTGDGTCLIFLVDDWEGVPYNRRPQEHTEIRWFAPHDIVHLVLAHPALLPLINRVCSK